VVETTNQEAIEENKEEKPAEATEQVEPIEE
jgi:hypothetical protein